MINVQTQPQPRRLCFTVDEYYKMIELGMLGDHEKAEIPKSGSSICRMISLKFTLNQASGYTNLLKFLSAAKS